MQFGFGARDTRHKHRFDEDFARTRFGQSLAQGAYAVAMDPPDMFTRCRAPLSRSPKLAAFVALACPPDMLTRYRAPLLTAQKTANLHQGLPNLSPF
jgi:hypothetical protein